MRYTPLTVSGRHRVLATGTGTGTDDARFVTTVTTNDDAKAIARALTQATDDLPYMLDWSLSQLTGAECLLVLDGAGPPASPFDGWDARAWEQAQTPTKPVALVRQVLSFLDNPHGEHELVRHGAHLRFLPLAKALHGQPESVNRAVRDEIAAALAPYDQVPVFAVVYDRKWDDVRTSVCINAALELLSEDQIDDVGTNTNGAARLNLLGLMEAHELADFSYAAQVAEAGYLEVAVHVASFNAWRAARGR